MHFLTSPFIQWIRKSKFIEFSFSKSNHRNLLKAAKPHQFPSIVQQRYNLCMKQQKKSRINFHAFFNVAIHSMNKKVKIHWIDMHVMYTNSHLTGNLLIILSKYNRFRLNSSHVLGNKMLFMHMHMVYISELICMKCTPHTSHLTGNLHTILSKYRLTYDLNDALIFQSHWLVTLIDTLIDTIIIKISNVLVLTKTEHVF